MGAIGHIQRNSTWVTKRRFRWLSIPGPVNGSHRSIPRTPLVLSFIYAPYTSNQFVSLIKAPVYPQLAGTSTAKMGWKEVLTRSSVDSQ